MSDPADFHLDGPFDEDLRLTYYNSDLTLSGWALLPDSACRLAVYAGDLLLGCIIPSEFRADLLAAFPWLAADATAGFNTTLQLPRGLTQADPDLLVRIAVERDGQVVKEGFWRVAQGVPRLEFYIDEAKILDGKLVCDQRNARFYGWAVCQEAIDGISVELGEDLRITAQYGITRADVFAVRPNNPNGPCTGFAVFIPLVPPDCDSLQFSITLASGAVLVHRFDLAVQAEAVAIPSFRRLSFAETHFLANRLAAAAPRPCFVILPQEHELQEHEPQEHEPEGASETTSPSQLQTTLASILATGTQGLRPSILIHADCQPAASPLSPHTRVFRTSKDLAQELAGHDNEWVLCLREGDTVAPSLGLFLHNHERAQKAFVYWDETAVSPRRTRTLYKVPGAPFITLLNHNFIGRGWAVRITNDLRNNLAVNDVAGYMLALPFAAFRTPDACAHIPEILSCHTYDANDLTPTQPDIAARNRVLSEVGSIYGRLSYQSGHLVLDCADQDLPRISVIIPTIGTAGRVLTALRGLRDETDYPNLEIIVIDHMPFSPKFLATKRQLRGLADQVLAMIGPFNWSKFNNAGAGLATGDIFLFLNDDIEITEPQWLRRLLPYLSQPSVGAVSPRLLTPLGSIQSCGVSLFDGEGAARNDFTFTDSEVAIGEGLNLVPHNCTSLLGAAILTRRETYQAHGGFEERLPVTFNDLDYNMKLRASGLQVAVITTASLVHYEKASRALIEEKPLEELYDRKWRRRHLLGDPYIHPALESESGMYKVHREPGDVVWSRNIAAMRADVRRILITRLDHIGDFTLSVPAFRLLRETFPDATIDAVVGPWNVALAKRLKLFDNVMAFNFYAERSGDGRELDEDASRQIFRERVGGQHYHLAIDLRLDGDTRRLLTLVDADFRAGFSEGLLHPWLDISLEWAGNLRSWRKNSGAGEDVRRLVMMIADRFPTAAGLDENLWQPHGLRPEIAPEVTGAISHRRQVVIHPFAGNEIKMWPAAKWRDLVALLHEDGVGVLMVGATQDAIREAATVESLTLAGAVNALGIYTLDELLNVIAVADCFIGCDSGPKHLAASCGIPVIGLQSGFVDPVMWGPMNASGVSLTRNVQCAPCYIDDAAKCPRQVACMTQIAVADVYRQVHRALAHLLPCAVAPCLATLHLPGLLAGNQSGHLLASAMPQILLAAAALAEFTQSPAGKTKKPQKHANKASNAASWPQPILSPSKRAGL